MESEKKINVSYFDNYNDTKPVEVELSQHLFSSRWKKQVEVIRREPDKEERNKLKSLLPCITPSGIFKTRCSSGIIRHSGLICIDIDGKDNPCVNDWEALKTTISHLPGLWYAGLSVSGNGIFALFRIQYPERHQEHFSAISADMENLGIVVDKSGKDICRLRGVSYDEHPVFNRDVTPYEKLTVENKQVLQSTINVCNNYVSSDINVCNNSSLSPINAVNAPINAVNANINRKHVCINQQNAGESEDRTTRNVQKLVERIERTGADITDDYTDWFAIGRALASEFGEYGRNWFHTVSAQSPKYKPHECNRQYDNCLRCCSRTTIRTFFSVCQRFGVTLK